MLYFFQFSNRPRKADSMKNLSRQFYAVSSKVCLIAICLILFNDFARGQRKSTGGRYQIKQRIFRHEIGATTIKIVVNKALKSASKTVYFNLHDNENTAAEAAAKTIERFGGTFIELQIEGKRLIEFSSNDSEFTIDPNRIFTLHGIKKTLQLNGEYSFEAQKEIVKFAGKLKGFLKKAKLVVAVHNNTDENYSIKSYGESGELAADVKLVNVNAGKDADDFFYVTDGKFYKMLKAENQNVALQDNREAADDGSLSIYCGRHKISYVNVESEHGHFAEQLKMLEILQKTIKNLRLSQAKKRK